MHWGSHPEDLVAPDCHLWSASAEASLFVDRCHQIEGLHARLKGNDIGRLPASKKIWMLSPSVTLHVTKFLSDSFWERLFRIVIEFRII